MRRGGRKETVGSWSFGVIQIWCRLFGGVAKFRIKFTQIRQEAGTIVSPVARVLVAE